MNKSIKAEVEKTILRELHPQAVSIEPIDNSECWSVLEEDGFNEYWKSYAFANGKPRHLGTTTIEV